MKTDKTEMKTETICFGDCLEHLKRWIRWNNDIFEGTPALADLIYLDPPWNSKANYNVLFGSDQASDAETQTAQETAFTDMWQWNDEAKRRVQLITGEIYHDEYHHHPALKSILAIKTMLSKSGILAYCAYMAERLALLRELLKDTGSIYLHCDPHASHYLKMVMDNIFGPKCYRNEIVWKRTSSRMAKYKHPSVHDVILFYAKEKHQHNKVFSEHDPEYIRNFYRHADDFGVHRLESLTGPGVTKKGDSGKPWRGVNPAKVGNHWAVPGTFPSHVVKPANWNKMSTCEKLDYLDSSGLIHWPKKTGGVPQFKRYLSTSKGRVMTDMILDIPPISAHSKENQNYDTQKPLPLLKRIIEASTNEGDVVLDPFGGCGTTVVAARQLGRKFVGIDISLYATETVAWSRLINEAKMPEKDIRVTGIPGDYPSAKRLAKDDPFAFEIFAVEACVPGMVANKSQRRDKGIDGKGWLLLPVKENGKKNHLILAQVKAGKPTLSQVRDFATVIRDTPGAVAGVFITLDKIGKEGDGTDDMREVAYQQGTFRHAHSMVEFPRMQFWNVKQFFNKTKHLRLPHLPELADPNNDKEKVPIRQTGFLTKMRRYSHG